MKLNTLALAIVILVLLCGGIVATVVLDMGKPKVDVSSLPVASAEKTAISSQSDNTTGEKQVVLNFNTPYKPAEIKGTNTFAEISHMFNVPLNDLGNAFGLTSIPNFSSLKARELKAIYTNLGSNIKLETESVRIFVSMYTGKPYTYSPTAYLPIPAVTILKQKAVLTIEQLAFLDTHTLNIGGVQASSITGSSPSNQPVVTGETSFQRLIDYGIPREEIEKAIGEKLSSTSMLIRDYASQRNKDFLSLISTLQELVNRRYPLR
jgi:hypothetical protein